MIFGTVLWQLITFIVFIATGENERKACFVGCGILIVFEVVCRKSLESIIFYFRYKNLRSMLICPDDKIRYCLPKHVPMLEKCIDKNYRFAKYKEHFSKEYSITLWRKEYRTFNEVANMRYTPKTVWSNFEPISKAEIKYAKNNF